MGDESISTVQVFAMAIWVFSISFLVFTIHEPIQPAVWPEWAAWWQALLLGFGAFIVIFRDEITGKIDWIIPA